MPGGSLTSKPTWSNTPGCSATSAFFVLGCVGPVTAVVEGSSAMEKSSTQAWRSRLLKRQSHFSKQRTGHEPQSVAVVLSGDTLLITLHGALSPAEKALAQSPEGASSRAGVPPAVVRQFGRRTATGNQANYRGRGARSDRGSRNHDGHHGAGVHNRHDGAGFLARPRRTRGQLEWKRFTCSILKREVQRCWSCQGKAVWNRRDPSVKGRWFPLRLLKVTVLGIKGTNVNARLRAFDAEVPVHRSEVWEQIHADDQHSAIESSKAMALNGMLWTGTNWRR